MKVKFTKLAALLLAGAALFVTGCTDYEVDIQKANERIDQLKKDGDASVASLNQQIDGLKATIATLETAADHKADIDKLNKTISDLESALRTALDTKVDRDVYNAKMTEIAKNIQDLEAADENFKVQIKDLTDELAKKVNQTDFDKAVADVTAAINGEISRAKAAEAALEAALEAAVKEINEINKQIKQIKDLQELKVDVKDFEDYKAATAETIRLINEAIATYVTKKEFNEKVDEIIAKFDDYVLTKDFEEFKKIAATKAELAELEATINGKLDALKKYVDDQDEAVKEYVNAEVKKLQGQIDTINGQIKELDTRVKALETSVKKVVDALAFAMDEETGEYDLQGYIDQAALDAYNKAVAYTDKYIELIIDQLNEILGDIYDKLTAALQRIQSIVYVPDYDDLKITVNMAYIAQSVAGSDNAEGGKIGTPIDQPFKVTYKILPAQYAEWVAMYATDLLQFDVKPLNTRAEGEEGDIEYGFEFVLDADGNAVYECGEDVEETGEITFTVMPVNIASAQFAANGLKPLFVQSLDRDYYYTPQGQFQGSSYYYQYLISEEGNILYQYGYDMYWGAYSYEDLQAFRARTAFAASLRMKMQDATTTYYYWEFPEYNEVASAYNVLYPAVTEIEILPDPYKPELDEDGNPKTDENGNTVLVKAVPEYQYLPYSALRSNPVGEEPTQDPKGYRVILDQVVPGISIEGSAPLTLEDAAKAGYLLPNIETVFDEFTYEQNGAETLDEKNFVETAQVYAEIEMNPEKTAAERKLAVGNIITGNYSFVTEMGKTPFFGQVEITKPLGSVAVDARIVWNWEDDAEVDHNLFYVEEGAEPAEPNVYARVEFPININAENAKYLEENLDVTLDDFAGAEPKKLTVTTKDENGEDVVVEDLVIENVAIKDGKLLADISNFEWDAVYTIVAEYELETALITVNGTITTVDRNREKVVLPLYEYTFVVNYLDEETGFGYILEDPVENSWYKWESDAMHAVIFKSFVDNGVINVEDNVDFAYADDQKEFNAGELEGQLRMAKNSGSAKGYVDINRDEIVAKTLKTLKASVLAGEIFSTGERSEEDPNLWLGNVVTRNVTTYIGEEVEIPFQFNIKVPDYNFLHLSYYTFNTDHANGNFVQNYNFDDNDGSVIWWTQVNPSYFTDVKEEGAASEDGSVADAQKDRESFRHALADYDVSYINLAELAFNVVDDKDVAIEDEDLEELGLTVNFIYTDKTQGEKDLPKVDQIDPDFLIYESLWVDNTVFYYRTNEKKFIPALGQLTLASGDFEFPVATRFEFPKAAVEHAEEVLDYSTYAMVRWTPFKAPVAEGFTIVLDENKIYREPLFKGMYLNDNRPNKVSYKVIDNGEWVVGNVKEWDSEAGTYTKGGNGYVEGIAADQAYHITTKFDYSTVELPVELKKLLTVKYSADGENFVDEQDEDESLTPYIVFDYTSQVQFRGTVEIPVVVSLENPWQETIRFVYSIIIKGVEE